MYFGIISISTIIKQFFFFAFHHRYHESSIKESTRLSRDQGSSRVYVLGIETKLPSQTITLTVSKNKAQMINLIVKDLVDHKDSIQTKLVITGSDPIPIEINSGVIIQRYDMRITHEEADTILIHQCASVKVEHKLIVAEDTDVFVLLCHFVHKGDILGSVKMVGPARNRAIIDINMTAQHHFAILPDLLAAHALTGCDTVGMCYGIGKAAALKILRSKQHSLAKLGDMTCHLDEVYDQALAFMLACYNQGTCQSMSDARYKIWVNKVSQRLASAPKIESLPPTDEAFKENVARAHLQAAIWKYSLDADPPTLDPCNYGWMKDPLSHMGSLEPITVPTGTPIAPEDILKLIRCGCDSAQPCKSQRCSCNAAQIACTAFCKCQGSHHCYNVKTNEYLQLEEYELSH